MTAPNTTSFPASLLFASFCSSSPLRTLRAAADEPTYDLVVYGGTTGGVAAPCRRARMGKTVVLIEPGKHLGGLTTGGLGATDIGNKGAIGGICREFYQRIKQHYADPALEAREARGLSLGPRQRAAKEDAMWTFEPHVAEKIYGRAVPRGKVSVVVRRAARSEKRRRKKDGRIVASRMEAGKTFRGKMFIDATYEGDLMAKAGVSYHVGREANATTARRSTACRSRTPPSTSSSRPVDPYVKPGDPKQRPAAAASHAGPPGEDGDGRQARAGLQLPHCADRRAGEPPSRGPSRPATTSGGTSCCCGTSRRATCALPWNPVLMPNRKTDSNNNFAFSTDHIGMNYDYPDGDYATRERICQEHIDYQQGLMWTLANHPRVPEKVREHFRRWGLAKDEFPDTDNWPHQLYVREARRMVGDYVMTEHNCQGPAVGRGLGRPGRLHDGLAQHRSATSTPNGHVRNEGDVQVGGFPPYPIAYRSIVPKASECTNLLVPVCLSASHIATARSAWSRCSWCSASRRPRRRPWRSTRSTSVQEVDYAKLRERLLADKQVLDWTGPQAARRGIDPTKLPGLVLDDDAGREEGRLVQEHFDRRLRRHAVPARQQRAEGGADRRRSSSRSKSRARTKCGLPTRPIPTGRRTCRSRFATRRARAKATLNEKATRQDRQDVPLRSASTSSTRKPSSSITNAGTNGYVVIDAVQLVPIVIK